MPAEKILIIDDEPSLRRTLRTALESMGHQVAEAGGKAQGLELVGQRQFDLALLDLRLARDQGLDILPELLRLAPGLDVVIITAYATIDTAVEAMRRGAFDYLPKPFNLSILIARVGSLLRRKTWEHGASRPVASPAPAVTESRDTFRFGDKIVDFENLRLQAGGETVQLTLMESELLRYFVQNAGKPVSRKAILENVWGLQEDTDTRAIDNFIVRLRKYLEADPSKPKLLLTVRGVGLAPSRDDVTVEEARRVAATEPARVYVDFDEEEPRGRRLA